MLLLAGCDIHTSDNGKLDGFWQLTQTDTLGNGRTEDMRNRQIFWSVQADIVRVADLKEVHAEHVPVFFHFEHKGDQLRLFDPVADKRELSDSIVNSVETVSYYGLGHLDETFRVLLLEETKMTLENERLRMYFRKF